jgi:hypothetical protein
MDKIEVGFNIKKIQNELMSFERKHLPFAMSQALNNTAWDAYHGIKKQLPKVFNKPTDFTLRGMYVQKSTYKQTAKNYLTTELGYKPKATTSSTGASLIKHHVDGGTRNFKRFEMKLQASNLIPAGSFLVPTGQAPKDRFGNVPRKWSIKALSSLRATLDTASYSSRASMRAKTRLNADSFKILPLGKNQAIYYNSAFGLTPFWIVVDKVHYRKRYNPRKIIDITVQDRFKTNFDEAMKKAVASAK